MKPLMAFALMGASERQVGTLLLLFLLAVLAVGIYEAWSVKRGVVGWIVSLIASFVGGIGGVLLATMVLDTPKLLHLDGTIIAMVGTLTGLLFGSWIVLRIVNRFR